MANFSIWHWLILVLMAYAVWRIVFASRPRAAPQKDTGAQKSVDKATRLPSEGAKPLSVAGIDYRLDDLRSAVAGKLKRYRAELDDAEEVEDDETVELDVVALLQFDDNNAHDKNAVKVLIGSRQVGFVPATMAPFFRSYVKRQKLPGSLYSCAAEVEVEVKSGDPVSMVLMLPPLK